MRKLFVVLAVTVLGVVACGDSAPDEAAVAAAPAAPTTTSTPAADTPAAEPEPSADAATETDTPAETVEESSGVEEAGDGEADLVLEPPAEVKVASKFKPNVHYRELVPAQPTVTSSDKIEVVEVFWYGCGHCYSFDPYIERWDTAKPDDVTFVRLPAVWNKTLQTHAAAFYTAEALAANGKLADWNAFHKGFFNEIHVNKQMLTTDRSLEAFFGRFGVSAADYQSAAKSFEVDQKLRTAMDLTRRYKITGVPAIVVNGRYANISEGLNSYEEYLELVDDLVALER